VGSKVRNTRRMERRGVNKLQTLLDEHNNLVYPTEGGADHGEDMHVGLVLKGHRTGVHIAIQVKSGKSFRRSGGFAIPVDGHREDWRDGNIPVIGVVYDPHADSLYWVNMTEYLRANEDASTIPVSVKNELDDSTVTSFITRVIDYVAEMGYWHRGPDLISLDEAIASATPVFYAGEPNLLFEPLARLVLRYETRLRRLLSRFWPVPIFVVMVLELRLQLEFAERYAPEGAPSAGWVFCIYATITLLIIVIQSERARHRFPRQAFLWLGCVAFNFLWFPLTDSPGGPDWIGRSWIFLGYFITNATIVFGFTFYTGATLHLLRSRGGARRSR
jgi:hypothetical protein